MHSDNKTRLKAGLKRYVSNTSWLLFERVLRVLSSIFVGVLIARHLGPNDLGILSYAQSIFIIGFALANFGLDSIVIRETLRRPDKINSIIGSTFIIKLITSSLVISLIFFLHCEYESNQTEILLILTLCTIFSPLSIFQILFNKSVQSKYIVISNIVPIIVFSLIKLYFVIYNGSIVNFAICQSLEVVASYILLILFKNKSDINFLDLRFDVSETRHLLKCSIPVLISSIMATLYLKVDQLMIAHLLDSTAVGIYASAARLSEAWYFIPATICSSLFPAIVNSKHNEAKYLARIQILYAILIWLAIILCLLISAFSSVIIDFVYGSAFSLASPVLTMHVWAGINVAIGAVWTNWITSENKQHVATLAHILGATINIGLNYFLIPIYGINGAAGATLVSYYLSAFFAFSLYRPKTTFSMITSSLLPWKIYEATKIYR
ncbi:flippase [Vibrio sp. M260118]|uniref:flippase n=1 Tax=Vibrio sp. M260118 TaxID=3020896 RepID=UPI002F3FC1FA